MRTFRLLAASLLVALSMGVSSCGDDVTNEIIQQEPDNTWSCCLVLGREQVKQRVKHLPLTKTTPIQK